MRISCIACAAWLAFFGLCQANQDGDRVRCIDPPGPGKPDPQPACKIGPFEISNDDGTSRLRFQFAGQLRLQLQSPDGGPGKARNNTLTAEARRIRLILGGSFPEHGLSFRLHLSLAPGSNELMDAYFDHNYWSGHRLRLGQYKIPFTRYRIQSFQRLTFADWSIVTTYFGAERQMGLTFHNGFENPPVFGYAIGIFTGVNARASHAVGLARLFGEVPANPSDLADPAPKAEFHPELVAHLSCNLAGITLASDSDDSRKGPRFSAALSAAWDLDPEEFHDMTIRLAPEFLFKYGGASVSGIGYAGFVDYSRKYCAPITDKLAITGGIAQVAYRFPGDFEISARYAVIDFYDDLVVDAFNRASRIISEAEENLAGADERELAQQYLDDILSRYRDIGYTYKKEEVTIGLNIYLDGHSLKWQNDAGWLIYSRSDEDRTDFTARSQLQLAF